jgi:hypothetical protein
MGKPDVRTRADRLHEPHSPDRPDESVLFVAAVAAALVEHRRISGQADRLDETEGSRANWKIATRLDQLRGRV